METLFFILIIVILIIGLFFMNRDDKETMAMGDEAIDNVRLENSFRRDQIDYYRKKNSGIHTNCEESNFVKLANNNSKLKEVKVCDFFTGKNIKENFDSSNISSMEASKYVEEIEQCRDLNNSLKRKLGPKSTIDDIKNELMQIPDQFAFNKFTGEEQIGEEDKGCGYCWDGSGFGEILYGDSLGPYKNVKTGSVCENWVKPGDIHRGGGLNLMNNKWKSKYDATTMKFGGNRGVVTDAIKLHEQKICSQVTGCGDLDGEKNICGWCYMGRKGDGKGEGMVAMIDENGKKIGETKYKDDYCPWPGEVKDGNPDPNKWTGPNDTSKWLEEAASKEINLLPEDIYNLDLKLQKDLKIKENAKKNDDTLDVNTRNLAKKAMHYIENKIRYISSFNKKGNNSYRDKLYTSDGKKNKLGDASNNTVLYKCGNPSELHIGGKDKNVFFLHNYSGLSSYQQKALKGLYETHEFLKKCQKDMSILGKKITMDDDEKMISDCNKLHIILNKRENKKLKDVFMKMDLSKDAVGCMENCGLKEGSYFSDKWTKNKQCTPLKSVDISGILGYDEFNKFKQGTRVKRTDGTDAVIVKRINTDDFQINHDGTLIDISGKNLELKDENYRDEFIPNLLTKLLRNETMNVGDINIAKSMFTDTALENIVSTYGTTIDAHNVWNILIGAAKTRNTSLFNGDFSLSTTPQRTNVLDSNDPLNTYDGTNGNIDKLIASNKEIDELSGEPQWVPDGSGNLSEREPWRNEIFDGINGSKINGSRLLINNEQCIKLNDSFPCFKNWFGKKDVNGKLPPPKNEQSLAEPAYCINGQLLDDGCKPVTFIDGTCDNGGKVNVDGDGCETPIYIAESPAYDETKPMGHSDACYDELWHTQTIADFRGEGGFGVTTESTQSCYEMNKDKSGIPSFKNAMDKTFPVNGDNKSLKEYTIDVMNKLPITSVKTDIQNIRITADTSHQYEAIYADGDITDVMGKTQILNSAEVATNACYGQLPDYKEVELDNEELPYSCQNRFRDKQYNFPRPRKCVDHFWKTQTNGFSPEYKNQTWEDRSWWNVGKTFHKLHPDFDKVWGNMVIPAEDYKDEINYATNGELATFLKENVDFLHNFKNTTDTTASDYDEYLIKKRLIYEYINEGEDKIWKDLKPDVPATDAGDEYPWVKMCWGDFKDALKYEFKKGINIVTENGDGTLNLEKAPKLKPIIDGSGNEQRARMVIKTKDNYEYSLEYGRRNKGGRIEFDHPKIPSSITEKLYNKTWFPFWRFFNKMDGGGLKYYKKEKFDEEVRNKANEANNTNFGWKITLDNDDPSKR